MVRIPSVMTISRLATTIDETGCRTSEAGMKMGEETPEAMIVDGAEVQGVGIGTDRQ